MKFLVALCIALLTATSVHAEVSSFVEREAFYNEVVRKTHARMFDQLVAESDALHKNKARLTEGVWTLTYFYSALHHGFYKLVLDDWQTLENQLLELARRHPQSTNAWLMYTTALDVRAWKLRGDGFSNTTTPQGRAGFKATLDKAVKILDDHKPFLSTNPQWYSERIQLNTYLGGGDAAMYRLLKEGIAKEPLFYDLYFRALFHRVPRWGGSIDAMAHLMNEVVKHPLPGEGQSMYARMAWFAENTGDGQVIDSPLIDWTLMKKSFHDVLRVYPTDWNAQKFFSMACKKRDKVALQQLLPFIKEPASPTLLGNRLATFNLCKDWASGKIPGFVLRDPETGKGEFIH